jgi:hypothetical protein
VGTEQVGAPGNVKPQSKRESGPVVDETAFQQLLSAAYVMQEHNRQLRKAPKPTAHAEAPVSTKPPVEVSPQMPSAQPIPFPVSPSQNSGANACKECGSTLASNEFFCEHCGAPAERAANTTQKNWASLWEMHHASGPEAKEAYEEEKPSVPPMKPVRDKDALAEEIDLFPAELEEIVGRFPSPAMDAELQPEMAATEQVDQHLTLVTGVAPPMAPSNSTAVDHTSAAWTSAAKARAWLDSLKAQQPRKDWFREEWTVHRGAIYIALAAAVLLAVVFQSSTQPLTSPGQPRQLSVFEQVLVNLGLAEVQPVSVVDAPGNPKTRVWVDIHTALYYCPGASLYGKTPDGRYTTQLDAQRDHFEPSTLKACD